MRAVALFVVLILFSLPTLSEASLQAECPERIGHLGGLLGGISQEQQTEALSLIDLLQKNGLFYSALIEALKSHGITPQKRQAWKWFVSDFYLLPERQSVVDETASRLILEFFGVPTDTIDQAVVQGQRTALGAGLFIEARNTLRKIEPLSRWSDIVEYAIFVHNGAITAELNARMRRLFPRATRPLLPFPPSLSEVRNAYAAVPVELVVFDSLRRLRSDDPNVADQVAIDLKKAGHGDLPVVEQALSRAFQLREAINQRRAQSALTLANRRAQSLGETLAEIDQATREREAAALTQSLRVFEERIARLEQKRAIIMRRLQAQRDNNIERTRLALRPVEKTVTAVVAMREAVRARRRFLRARRDWRESQQTASSRLAVTQTPAPLSLAAQLSRDTLDDLLHAYELDSQQLEIALLGNPATLTPDQFTQNAVYMLKQVADGDLEFSENDLVAMAESVLNAARKLNFKLSIAQVETIRHEMKEAGDYLDDPDSVENEETARFRRAQNNLAWLHISDTTLINKSHPTEFERSLREAGFVFEVDRLDAVEADELDLALVSLFSARGLTSEQLTSMIELFFDGLSTNYESTQTIVVEKICQSLWGFQPGLSEAQIGRVRAAMGTFTEDMEDADEKRKVRAVLNKADSWMALAGRYSAQDDVAAESNSAIPIATPAQETLPEEIEELRLQAQRLSRQARRLRQDPDSARAYDTETLLRGDLKAVLAKMEEGSFKHNVDAVEEILTAAYQSLSTDRFTAVFNEVALLYAFKNEVSSDQDEETAYCKMLLKFLRSTHLSSSQAASIGATFIRVLALTDEKGTKLVGDNTEDTVVPGVCEWLLGLPHGIEVADADLLCKALRDLAAFNDSDDVDNHASAVWLLRWATDTRWLSRTERTPASTEERLRAVERELAENEVELQKARAALQAAAGES